MKTLLIPSPLTNHRRSQALRLGWLPGLVAVWLGWSTLLPAQTTILSEGFEGVFPQGNGWSVGDGNASGTPAYWEDVNAAFGGEGAHSGSWKGYCAGIGYGGDAANPTYQTNMSAYMSRTIDLSGYTSATLTFWYKMPSIENCCDRARVLISLIDPETVWSSATPIGDWILVTIDLTGYVGYSPTLTFQFDSDYSISYEGWYLDDILVTGIAAPPNDQCDGAIALANGVSFEMDTTGATHDSQVPVCQNDFSKGVWFTYIPAENGTVEVSTCGRSFNTVLQVYTGGCRSLTPVAGGCNDNNGPACDGVQASVRFEGVGSTTYWILAGGFDAASGFLEITARLIGDTQAPAITCPPDLETNTGPGQCSQAVSFTVTATDNLDPHPTVTCVPPTGSVFPLGENPVHCVATDASGNSNACMFVVLVRDTEPPQLSCPANRTVECGTFWMFGTSTATDNCPGSIVRIEIVDTLTNRLCGSGFTATRTWQAMDSAGRVSLPCSQTVTVLDTTPPRLLCAPGQTVECGSALTFTPPTLDLSPGVVFWTDFSAQPADTYVYGNAIVAGGELRLTEGVADQIGSFIINDFNQGQPITQFTARFQAKLYESGCCFLDDGTPRPADGFSFNFAPDLPDTAFGEEGEGSGLRVTFDLWDNGDHGPGDNDSAPAIAIAYNGVELAACPMGEPRDPARPPETRPIPTDPATGQPMLLSTEPEGAEVVIHLNPDGSVNVYYKGVGVLTNVPTGYAPTPGRFGFGARTGGANSRHYLDDLEIRLDDCPEVGEYPAPWVVSTTTNDSVHCPIVRTVTRTWRATDDCGNQTDCDQTIAVVDNTAPQITCPSDRTMECDQPTDPAYTVWATATDVCDPHPSVFYSDRITPGRCPAERLIVRTWEAVDRCGNTSTCTQQITVVDTTPPVLAGCPTNVTVECHAVPDPTVVVATDNCDPNPSVSLSETRTPGACPQAYRVTRTWTATDTCGNAASCTQTVTVRDSGRPSITCPPPLTVECEGLVPACPASLALFHAAGGIASDNCDTNLDYLCLTGALVGGRCGGTLTRTHIVTDDCGNFNACEQTITIRDTVAPSITCPSNLTVQCLADVPLCPASLDAFRNAGGVASDNCGTNLDYLCFTGSLVGGPCGGTLTRIHTVTDECANSNRCFQTITVRDTQAPVLAGCANLIFPADRGQVSRSNVIYNVSATDNCGSPQLVCDPPSGSTFELGETPVNCTATDLCGDEASCGFTVMIQEPAFAQPLIRNYTPPPWQADDVVWIRDVDPHNKIDDTIDNEMGGVFDVVVNFKRCVREDDLSQFPGKIQRRLTFLSSVAIGPLTDLEVQEIAQLPDVAFIEQQFGFSPALDVSVPSLCVAAGPCSPQTIQEAFPGIDGTGINIVIMDSGVDNSHLAFANTPFVGGYDAMAKPPAFGDPDDDYGHGTHVASIALGQATANTARGVAPGAGLIDVRVSNASTWCDTPGQWTNIVDGLETTYEQHIQGKWSVDVINMSFGQCNQSGRIKSDGLDAFSQLVDLAETMGIVVVAAADNQGPNNQYLPTPAAATRAITVAAVETMNTPTRADDVIACFSNRGPRSSDNDGDQMDELKPEVAAPGTHVTSCSGGTITGIFAAEFNTTTGEVHMQGTSMAAPHVAGLAALIRQARPGINAASVKDLIIRSATPMGTPSLPAIDPVWNEAAGWGEVNGFAALNQASQIADLQADPTFPSHPPTPHWLSPDITVSPNPPQAGQPATVTVVVTNRNPTTAVGARIHFGVHVYSAATPTFYDIGTQIVDIPASPAPATPVSVTWMPQQTGHQCLKVEIAYGPDIDYSNNTAQRNLAVQASPTGFEVRNIWSDEPALIRLVPSWADPNHSNWSLVLQPMQVELGAGDCPQLAEIEVFPNGMVPLGEVQRVDVAAVVDTSWGPITLGGISVLASNAVPPIPLNDLCGDAIPLINGVPYESNTAGATATGDPLPMCQTDFGKGVWFTFTPPDTGLVTVSTCGSDFDTVLQVYSGPCDALVPVARGCKDNSGPSCLGLQASLNFDGEAGTLYYLLAGGFGGAGGNLRITASQEIIAEVELTVALSGGHLAISWPVSAGSCYQLYSTPSLAPPSWRLVSDPVLVLRDQYTVEVVPGEGCRFYCLICRGTTVTATLAAQIAEGHAATVWDGTFARGEPIPVADANGAPFSYVVPFRQNAESFPPMASILDTVAGLKAPFGPFPADEPENLPAEFYAALEEVLGPMGYVQVSASRSNYPVLLVQNCLHPYFLFQDSARERAEAFLNASSVTLEGYCMLAPQYEYFAFSSGRDWAYIHARTLQAITPEAFRALPTCRVPDELAADRDQAWTEALLGGGALSRSKLKANPFKWITNYDLIPIVDWTYWCVPTAFTMATCYYDHYANGHKVYGFGRIVDYWYENGKGHNVPNYLDELIDPNLSPPSWRAVNVLNDPAWNGYAFSINDTKGNAGNDWAWTDLVNELDTDRPAVWGSAPADNTTGHAMTAFGYRVVGSQRFVIVYNTWGTTFKQQYAEYNYNQWIFGGEAKATGFAQILPGGPTTGHDGLLLSPRGGEVLFGSSQIQWQIMGSQIQYTDIDDSTDAGKNWTFRKSISTPGTGTYTTSWSPPSATFKGRVRIRCRDASGGLVAGDGSVNNVVFQALPDLMPVASAPGYCNLQAGKLVVVVANQGPVGAPASTTEVRFTTLTGPQAIQIATPAIPANSSVELLFTVPGACWDPDCNFEIRIDVLNQVNEAIETNNLAAGACVG